MDQTDQIEVSGSLNFIQAAFGCLSYLVLGLPYLRRVHGLEKLNPQKRYLFVCNHVSLLDTLLLGGLLSRMLGLYPILVLGDKKCVGRSRGSAGPWSSAHRFFARPRQAELRAASAVNCKHMAGTSKKLNLLVFPEGTRGNGVDVAECQPGDLLRGAGSARAPIVLGVSSRICTWFQRRRENFIRSAGWEKSEAHYGEADTAGRISVAFT